MCTEETKGRKSGLPESEAYDEGLTLSVLK